jgi:DNA mismatch repair protein MutL
MRVYLNGRVINDRSINHALKEAYRGLIDPTRSPTVVLFIEMDPGQVDVNVHPAKSEVRFRNQAQVHRAVRGAVSGALKAADLVPAFDLARATGGDPGPRPALGGRLGGGSVPASDFVDSFRRLDTRTKGFVYSEVKEALARETPELLRDEVVGAMPTIVAPLDEGLPRVRVVQDALQVHASYIVTQDAEGMVIIDQHALHERVMFEKLKARVEAGPLESQRLLVPAIIEIDRGQRETFGLIGDLLTALGIEATAGDDAVTVHSFTSLLFERNVDPVSFMPELLATAQRHVSGEQSEAALHEVLDMMACKAAIKAGDRLEPGEIDELLAYRETVERSSRCPHGRPTTLRLSIEDLERQFGRR